MCSLSKQFIDFIRQEPCCANFGTWEMFYNAVLCPTMSLYNAGKGLRKQAKNSYPVPNNRVAAGEIIKLIGYR